MKKLFLFVTFIGLFSFSCSKEEVNNVQNKNDDNQTEELCEGLVEKVSESNFNEINVTSYTISKVNLTGNCLEISIVSSGCDPEPWTMNLFGKNNQNDSSQKDIKMELINNQICLAVIGKTKSFNLTTLQKKGQNEVIINLEGWDEEIIYKY